MLRFEVIADGGLGDPSPCWLNTPCVLCVETVFVEMPKAGNVKRDDLAAIRLVDGSVLVVVGNPAVVAERIRCLLEGIDESQPCCA